MINLLTSASRFLNDTENFNSTTDKLLSSLFDGFIFYLAVVVFIITVLIITAKYRKNPTLGKRKSLTAITVLLTVFDSLLLLFKIDFFSFFATLTTISQATISLPLYREQANMQYMCRTISL